MKRTILGRWTRAVWVAGAALVAAAGAGAAAARPNLVFIMADDLGYADVGFNGGTLPTPHLDRLAREGVRLTQHYSAATCSPTRVALQTGRYWSRFGILGPDAKRAMRWDTETLPRALQRAGYETAMMGKWHLGSKPEWGPQKFGYDHSYGSLGGGVGSYVHLYKKGEYSRTWHRNGTFVTEQGHVTDLIADEAVTWIAGRGAKPFFLYLPFTAVHLPIKEPPEWLDRVPADIAGEVPRLYAACILHLDAAVGRVVAALEKAGLRENTLIVFTSDNGGSWAENADTSYPGDTYAKGRLTGNNRPWRGQKGELYEGGIRVPTLANWPGKLAPGTVDVPLHIVDWMPTLLGLAGHRPAADLKWDGRDMWPQIAGKARTAPERTLYWTTPRGSALRSGDWKLIVAGPRNAKGPLKDELFDLAKDPQEKTDLAERHPEKVAELKARLAEVAKRDRDALPND